jgi:hypothetical protein
MDMGEIIQWNEEQREHEQIFQRLCLTWCHDMAQQAITHDNSKWSEGEYRTFLGARDSLRGSATGQDKEYAKHYNSEAIQHHVRSNNHHPEFWPHGDMPVVCIVMMFFDWLSRSMQKGTGLSGFWEYNLKKLEHQPHAIPIVEALRREYEIPE